MARSKSSEREARQARERLRTYTARQQVHNTATRRRQRDNLIAVVVTVAIVALVTVAQLLYFDGEPSAPVTTPSPSPQETQDSTQLVGDIPPAELSEFRTWTGELTLNDGVTLDIELDGAAAPQAVAAFVQQVNDGYFTAKSCHRLTTGNLSVIQCGSLDGTGAGDPDFRFGPLENTPVDNLYSKGVIALARAGGDAYSQGHQFFIVYETSLIPRDAAGGYTIFGRVTDGLERLVDDIVSAGVVDDATDGPPVIPTTITSVTVQ